MENFINCCVKNCQYNNNIKNTCTATNVSVSNCSCNNSKTSAETMCSTFIPKK